VAEDAEAACQVMRRSIAELCFAHHRNDPRSFAAVARKQNSEFFMSWLNQPDNSLLVAVEDGKILAVGSIINAGKITLNYVSPDARFRGSVEACSEHLKPELRRGATYNACSQDRNRPPLLYDQGLCGRWTGDRRIRDDHRLPDDQTSEVA
jgi:hypothetical protein